jgi:integrase
LFALLFGRQEVGALRDGSGLNTTMRACEIKSLRWFDVDFLAKTVTIRMSKTGVTYAAIGELRPWPYAAVARLLPSVLLLYKRSSARRRRSSTVSSASINAPPTETVGLSF